MEVLDTGVVSGIIGLGLEDVTVKDQIYIVILGHVGIVHLLVRLDILALIQVVVQQQPIVREHISVWEDPVVAGLVHAIW